MEKLYKYEMLFTTYRKDATFTYKYYTIVYAFATNEDDAMHIAYKKLDKIKDIVGYYCNNVHIMEENEKTGISVIEE